MSRANERAEETSSEHEILRRAERHSAQVIKDAQAKSDQIIREAEGYAMEQLKQLEAHLGRTLATVRRGGDAPPADQPAAPRQASHVPASSRPRARLLQRPHALTRH